MSSLRFTTLCSTLLLTAFCAAAEVYYVSDITGWTAAQMAELPFAEGQPIASNPAWASSFYPLSMSSNGNVCGYDMPIFGNAHLGKSYFGDSWQTHSMFGVHSWSYWAYDGHDWHYYAGVHSFSDALDINDHGTVVGKSTISGTENGPGYNVKSHGYIAIPDSGAMVDLTPESDRGEGSLINNRGQIVVSDWRSGLGSVLSRIEVNGSVTPLVPYQFGSPVMMDEEGTVVGGVFNGFTGRTELRVTADGTNFQVLPALPGKDDVRFETMNNRGQAGGNSYQFNTIEYFPTFWQRNAAGTWQTFNLNSLVDTNLTIDTIVSIYDDGRILATGHPDGTDALSSRRLLLEPISPYREITGTLNLMEFEGGSVGKEELTVSIDVLSQSGTLLDHMVARVNANGEYSAYTPIVGTRVVRAKVAHWLSESAIFNLSANPVVTFNPPMRNGDVNGDNQVDLADYLALASVFDSERWDGIYQPDADLNGDGSVNLSDYLILVAQFDSVGS